MSVLSLAWHQEPRLARPDLLDLRFSLSAPHQIKIAAQNAEVSLDQFAVCPKPISHLQQLFENSRGGAPDIQGFVAKMINDACSSIRFELCRKTIRLKKSRYRYGNHRFHFLLIRADGKG